MGWYDRKVRHVRDLSYDDMRIFLEVEVRRPPSGRGIQTAQMRTTADAN
jgi:hypothetical protein